MNRRTSDLFIQDFKQLESDQHTGDLMIAFFCGAAIFGMVVLAFLELSA